MNDEKIDKESCDKCKLILDEISKKYIEEFKNPEDQKVLLAAFTFLCSLCISLLGNNYYLLNQSLAVTCEKIRETSFTFYEDRQRENDNE